MMFKLDSEATQLGDFIPRSPEGEFNNEVIGSDIETFGSELTS